jgi:tetratricopeptide (TPR) repeat protein
VKPNRTISLWVAIAFILPMSSAVRRCPAPSGVLAYQEPAALRELRRQGNTLYRSGRYSDAIRTYETGVQEAKLRGDWRSALRFLNNLGSAEYQLYRHRDAIKAYLQAKELARSEGDEETLAAALFNLSSLYDQMGETDLADECVKQGMALWGPATRKIRGKLLIQSAQIRSRRGEWNLAVGLLRDAIEVSRAELDTATESQAWNTLGDLFVDNGRLESAERALLEAFRLRKLVHDDRILYSYQSLGRLRRLQGDLVRARMLLDHAIEEARAFGPPALWGAYYERGAAGLSGGQLELAFDDFRTALEYLGHWRAEVIPADTFRVSSEVDVAGVYSAFIEVASRLYEQSGRWRYAESALSAAEANRAASLRALWAGGDLISTLPMAYRETLAELRRAEQALLTDAGSAAAVQSLRLQLAEMEARAGLDLPPAGPVDVAGKSLLKQIRFRLRPDETLFEFHIREKRSFLWVIARDGFRFVILPGASDLRGKVTGFVKALSRNSPDAAGLGQGLYRDLFGGVPPELLGRSMWIIAPDGPLFELPFAALREETGSQPALYVIERHTIRIVPGVSVLFGSSPQALQGPYVAIADPVYNRADPRLPAADMPPGVAPDGTGRLYELARLPGTAREVDTCVKTWQSGGHETIVLKGADANTDGFRELLRKNPSVFHIAAHIVFPPVANGPGMIALALRPGASVQFVSATEIATTRSRVGLVVLDGCSSANAPALPGAGLMGLTRAWLAAGARAVVATRWATGDQHNGDLFHSFYNRLASLERSGGRISFSRLLQQAQIAELTSGDRRADPGRWAAYFCVERD